MALDAPDNRGPSRSSQYGAPITRIAGVNRLFYFWHTFGTQLPCGLVGAATLCRDRAYQRMNDKAGALWFRLVLASAPTRMVAGSRRALRSRGCDHEGFVSCRLMPKPIPPY